jgi:hypothetical protein
VPPAANEPSAGSPRTKRRRSLRYREANGNFKAWDDLSKIPEFDVKKIENKKAFVTF